MLHYIQILLMRTMLRTKYCIYYVLSLCFLSNCTNKKLVVDQFKVSTCCHSCNIDSVGVRTKIVEDKGLYIKLGYFLNCTWSDGYFKSIKEQNDTLIIELDRPHSNGEYPIVECDCFINFEMILKDYGRIPRAVRVLQLFEEDKYWDEILLEQHEILEPEEINLE